MSNPIDDLKSTISSRGGMARPNLFSVNFAFPGGLNFNQKDMTILCESASLPGRNINTNEFQSTRQALKMPYGFINEDVNFTFLLTNDFELKKVFDSWLESIIDTENYVLKYRDDYATDVTINQLNKEEEIVYTVRLQKAFPISLNTIELSNATENDVQRVTVAMTYENYTVE